MINLSAGVRHEQRGIRPAVVMAHPYSNILIVIPLTSNLEALRFAHSVFIKQNNKNGLMQDSIILLSHIRSVDISRIQEVIGKIDKKTMEKIDLSVKAMLKL